MKRPLHLKIICIISAAALLAGTAETECAAADAPPVISASACIVCSGDTGEVIYEKAADKKLPIASTTKLMTALVVLENCSPDETFEIKREWAATEGSSMGLCPGEICSVRELLYGLLLASGNDAGVALACHTAGSVSEFAALMNKKAEKLGMLNSHFMNPHGLDDAEHYSTARDMALLAAAVLENSELALIVSTEEARLSQNRYFSNHNRLLWECEGCIGLKTGYTSKAGRTLVSCCERDGTRFICITLCDPCDWADHKALYDWAFGSYKMASPCPAGAELYSLPVISGTHDTVGVCVEDSLKIFTEANAEITLCESLPNFVYAPIYRGEPFGKLEISVNGEKLTELVLTAAEDVPLDENVPLDFWGRVRWSWYRANKYAVLPRTG